MAQENNNQQFEFIDIASSSKSNYDKGTHIGDFAEKYGNGIFKNIGTIIKFIAFVICFFIIAVSFVGAYFLFSFDKFFMALAVGFVVAGLILGLISLFLIYGLGQIVCQNNEILSRLNQLINR